VVAVSFDDEKRALAAGERFVAAAGTAIAVWDRQTRQRICELKQHRMVRRLAFTSGDRRLLAADAEGWVSCWDVPAWTLTASWQASRHDVWALAESADLVATGDGDGQLQIRSLRGEVVAEARLGGWIDDLAWSHDGRLVVAIRSAPARTVLLALR
jgi:hypothetical protein